MTRKQKQYLRLCLIDKGKQYLCEVYDENRPRWGPLLTFLRDKEPIVQFDLEEIASSARIQLLPTDTQADDPLCWCVLHKKGK